MTDPRQRCDRNSPIDGEFPGGWMVIPVKGTSENEVVIGRQAAQTGLILALVDQTAGLVDDDQGEDCPGRGRHVSCA